MDELFSQSEKEHIKSVLGEGSDKKEAMDQIRRWKELMKMVEDHISFLQDKRLAHMEEKLKIANEKFKQGEYDWIFKELFYNGSPLD